MKTETILSAKEMQKIIRRMAAEIIERNIRSKKLTMIGIRTGGVFLAKRLKSEIEKNENINIPFGILDITLYRDDLSRISYHPQVRETAIPFSIDNIKIVLVDDVLYTGRTIRSALDAIMDLGRPSEIQLAVLVDRGGRELPIRADFVGLHFPVRENERIEVIFKEEKKKVFDLKEGIVLLKK